MQYESKPVLQELSVGVEVMHVIFRAAVERHMTEKYFGMNNCRGVLEPKCTCAF